MENLEHYYQESGKNNPLSQLVAYISCVLLSLTLGYLYSVLIIFIPIVYLNFLITVGLGLTLGLILRFLVRITNYRNKKSKLILALVFGFLTNYFQWTVYILYAFNGEIPNFSYYLSNLQWIALPTNFLEAVVQINRTGLWSIFGIVFTGFGLTTIWIIESLIIMAGPLVAIYKTKAYPFSELLNKWYPKYTLLKDFESVSAIGNMTRNLETDPLKSIQELKYGSAYRHTKIHLFYLKDDPNQYLTFENVYVNNRGQGKKNSTIIINNFKIDKESAQKIFENFEHKRERTEVI